MSALQDLQSSMFKAAASFNDELSGNERFRRMIWLIVYILICYGIVGLGDLAGSFGESAATKRSELARLSSSSGVSLDTWEERKNTEASMQQQILGQCWSAKQSRLASADMQTALQQVARNYSLKNSRLTLSSPETMETHSGQVWQIRAQVRGRIAQRELPSLIKALEYAERSFAVEKMHFVDQRGGGSLNLTLVACFRDLADE